ncbi:MAG: LPS export ABC transporter permease LptG [Chromatiaceae bacterium]|nr:MAG: LPS export ABC transporter permease LptG [Chromatiaceae bacterium]
MLILDRYLGAAVIGGTLLTLAVLLPLLGVFILADEMDAIGTGEYGLGAAMLFVTLSLPRYAYQVFPIATLIGALTGLGALAARSELVAMRAAGLSIARIVRGALLGGLALALTAVVVGEVVAPPAEQRAMALRTAAQTGDVVQMTGSGFWARDGNAFISIGGISPGAEIEDIRIFEVEGNWLRSVTHARRAFFRHQTWTLTEIRQTLLFADRMEVVEMEQAAWDSLLSPQLLRVIVVPPQVLPIWGLYRYVDYMRLTEQDPGPYQVAFWGKAVHPLLVLAMIFIAIPVLLGSARSTSTGTKVFFGIVIGIAFYLVSRTFAYLALLYQFNAALAALLPPLLFVLAALWVLRRVG